MEYKSNKLRRILAIFIFIGLTFLGYTNKIKVSAEETYEEQNLQGIELINASILEVESYLGEKETTVLLELNNKKNYYTNLLEKAEVEEYDKIEQQIAQTEYEIDVFQRYKNNDIDYLTQDSIEFIEYYYSAAVSAIIAGFTVDSLLLSAELLSYMMSNQVLDANYAPIHANILKDTSLFKDNIAYEKEVVGSAGFTSVGIWGYFSPYYTDIIECDAYNALGSGFNFYKKYYDEENVKINIKDKYDFDPNKSGLLKLCYEAQEAGVLTPFYTIVNDIILPGVVAFDCIIQEDEAVITGRGHLNELVIPNYIKKFGYETKDGEEDNFLPNIPVTQIKDSSFYNAEYLKSITISSTVTYIGNYAFNGCTNLEKVFIKKETCEIISLGIDVFSGCSLLEEINVPINKILEYKNGENWTNYSNLICYDGTIMSYDLNCKSDFNIVVNLDAGYNGVYKLEVDCVKSYLFTSSGEAGIELNVYNSNMTLIDVITTMTNENCIGSILIYLAKGTYYLDVNFIDDLFTGIITTNCRPYYPSPTQQVFYSDVVNKNDVLPHLHNISSTTSQTEVYYINNNASFYRFTLTGVTVDGESVVYPASVITIKNHLDEEVIDKYTYAGYENEAISKENINSMVVYLYSEGYYYIHINIPKDNLMSLYLDIKSVEYDEVDIFNILESDTNIVNILDSETTKGDYIKKVKLNETGKFMVGASYLGSQTNDILFVILKENNESTLDNVLTLLINSDSTSYVDELILEEGIYYIGYFNKETLSSFNVLLSLKYNTYSGDELILDPQNRVCGSQINIVEDYYQEEDKTYLGNTILKGFTRIMYLNSNLDDTERDNYYFYVSDDEVITISSFGTILAKKVGNAKVIAINKVNPEIIYVKEIMVVDNDEAITEKRYIHIYDTFDLTNEVYKLNLTAQNCPYPMIQYYNWTVESENSELTVTLDEWGNLIANTTGEVTITGEYSLNSMYVVVLHLTIV